MKFLVLLSLFQLQSIFGFSQTIYNSNVTDSSSTKALEAAVIRLSTNIFTASEDGSISFQFRNKKHHFFLSAFGNLIEQLQISLVPETIQMKKSFFNLQELVIIIDNSLQSQWNEVPFVTKPVFNIESNSVTETASPLFLKMKLVFTF